MNRFAKDSCRRCKRSKKGPIEAILIYSEQMFWSYRTGFPEGPICGARIQRLRAVATGLSTLKSTCPQATTIGGGAGKLYPNLALPESSRSGATATPAATAYLHSCRQAAAVMAAAVCNVSCYKLVYAFSISYNYK